MVGVWEEQSKSFFVQRHDLVEKLKELACVREDKTSFQKPSFQTLPSANSSASSGTETITTYDKQWINNQLF